MNKEVWNRYSAILKEGAESLEAIAKLSIEDSDGDDFEDIEHLVMSACASLTEAISLAAEISPIDVTVLVEQRQKARDLLVDTYRLGVRLEKAQTQLPIPQKGSRWCPFLISQGYPEREKKIGDTLMVCVFDCPYFEPACEADGR